MCCLVTEPCRQRQPASSSSSRQKSSSPQPWGEEQGAGWAPVGPPRPLAFSREEQGGGQAGSLGSGFGSSPSSLEVQGQLCTQLLPCPTHTPSEDIPSLARQRSSFHVLQGRRVASPAPSRPLLSAVQRPASLPIPGFWGEDTGPPSSCGPWPWTLAREICGVSLLRAEALALPLPPPPAVMEPMDHIPVPPHPLSP